MRSSEQELSSNHHGRVQVSSSSGCPSPSILSQDARRRTMEEVWKDMTLSTNPSRERPIAPMDPHHHRYSHQQYPHHARPTASPSFRAMILQDFLSRAPPPAPGPPMEEIGALPPPPPPLPLPPTVLSLSSAPEMPFMGSSSSQQLVPCHPSSHSRSSSNSSSSLGGGHGSGNNDSCVTGSYISPAFSDAIPAAPPSPAGLFSFCPKKRDADSPGVGGDRRHKRMIKNRESAARSRARKQAYTNELELEVAHLLEENAKLKKQHEELRSAMAAQLPTKKTLQRCSTAPF